MRFKEFFGTASHKENNVIVVEQTKTNCSNFLHVFYLASCHIDSSAASMNGFINSLCMFLMKCTEILDLEMKLF